MPNKGNAPARVPDCHPDRKHLARGKCKPCYDRDRADRDRDGHNARKRKWSRENPDRRRATKRRYLYGIDEETVRARLNAQSGFCAICREKPATDLDHDHKTRKARGLLCGDCNRGLGLFHDSRARLLRAVEYLDLWVDAPAKKVTV